MSLHAHRTAQTWGCAETITSTNSANTHLINELNYIIIFMDKNPYWKADIRSAGENQKVHYHANKDLSWAKLLLLLITLLSQMTFTLSLSA
jgi:hypothetical protein